MNYLLIASLIICVFFPVWGIFLILAILLKSSFTNKELITHSVDNNTLLESNYTFFPDIDINKDSNIISLKDSLEISQVKYRRETVLNILKEDLDIYGDFLKLAIKNEDAETTHYVATSILKKKMELDNRYKNAQINYIEEPANVENALEYIEVIKKLLIIPYLDEQLKKEYINEEIKILRSIVDKGLDMSPQFIIDLINLYLELNKYQKAKIYCFHFMNNYPDTETKFLTLLKCFYTFKDYSNFQFVLSKMAQENNLSKEAITIMNFWLGGNSGEDYSQ